MTPSPSRLVKTARRTGALAPFVALLVLEAAVSARGESGAASLFKPPVDVSLGPGVSRTDYESIDAEARRLYIADMGAGKVLVFDITKNKLAAALDGVRKATGVLVVPELHKLYASAPGSGILPSLSVGLGMAGLSSGRGTVAVFDTQSLREIAQIPGGVFPDGIAYDPKERRVFVSDELGSAIVAIDADSNKQIARVRTGGQVGNVRYDPMTAKVFAPDQSHNKLIVIDPVRMTIVARHATTGGEHPHGFIVAPRAAIGYVACDGNDRLLTMDLSTGRVLGNAPVAHDPDVLALDPEMNRLYVASESGNLSAFDIHAPASPVPLGETFVGDDAHAVAVDPLTHMLYLALANANGRLVLRELVPSAP